MYKVTVRGPDGSETHYPLGPDQGLIIGRDETADIVLASKRVSRRHARLYTSGSQLQIEDLESQNGVFVGGARISGTAEFRAGPPIEIGEFSIRVKKEDLAAPENSYAGLLQGYGKWEGKSLQLPKAKGIVGRDETADLVVDSESVSRKHAEIRFAGAQGYFVQDLGSSNGTFINGARLPANAERPLRPNDRINFGETGWLVAPQTAAANAAEAQSNRRTFARFTLGIIALAIAVVVGMAILPQVIDPPGKVDAGIEEGPSALDRCQQAISDEKWAEAIKSCGEAYDQEPFVGRRQYLRQAKREARFKEIFDSCMLKAQVGADKEAMECFFGIDVNSAYFPKAKLEIHQLSARFIKSEEIACRSAIRQKNADKTIEHCKDYLRFQCNTGPDKELQTALDKILTQRKLPAFACPTQLAMWFTTGVTERYRQEDYCEAGGDKNICEALLSYAQKKPTADVVKSLAKAGAKYADLAKELSVSVEQIVGEYGQGLSAAQGSKWTDADAHFAKVMDLDAKIMKQGMVSDYVKDIRNKMGDHYQKAGDDAVDGEHYDDAFKAYKAGLPYRASLEQKLQSLEKIASSMLNSQPTCDRFKTIQTFTRPESIEFKEAVDRLRVNNCPP